MYTLEKIVGSNNFYAQFIKIISHYETIGFYINVLQYTVCLVVNPITVGNFAFLLGRASDSMTVRLKDLSIDEMVGGLMLWLLSDPQGFTFWISFAPVFSFIYCGVLIFALSPFNILMYMF